VIERSLAGALLVGGETSIRRSGIPALSWRQIQDVDWA
jgi:hypothetical protein